MTGVLVTAAAAAFADPIPGVIEGVDAHRVTVSGRSYMIEKDTELTDFGGDRIALAELKPGTEVEIDLDEAGHLVVLRAHVIR